MPVEHITGLRDGARLSLTGAPPSWVVYSPLLPLFLLLFTGLYMFALPYAVKWRSGGGAEGRTYEAHVDDHWRR
jgi:hypothetical protein